MLVNNIWSKVSPFWPIQNLVACNPFWGYVDKKFDDILINDINLFRIKEIPKNLEDLNLHTIKYLQAFFDESQSIIKMPNKQDGLLQSSIGLLIFDNKIASKLKRQMIKSLPMDSNDVINHCLNILKVPENKREIFLEILLVTLSGWTSFIKYKSEWENTNLILESEFLALRVLIFTLISDDWQSVITLAENKEKGNDNLQKIKNFESKYQGQILQSLSFNKSKTEKTPDAQFIFCIDVRSEPLRRQIEKSGNYETFGFAGFFGIPVQVHNNVLEESYPSCPVLLKPKHDIHISTNEKKYIRKRGFKKYLKHLYSNFKYNFTTPLLLVDFLGIVSALTILKRLFKINKPNNSNLHINTSNIPFNEKISYANGLLTSIGLTKNFAKRIVIAGHGSHTTNNTFATGFDCGACGGRHGGDSAQIMTEILNDKAVRNEIDKLGIKIPGDTLFIPALHNTTTNEIKYYNEHIVTKEMKSLTTKKIDSLKSLDWSETRPEWGLAKNASFIVGPRNFTKNINLDGRSFLHSYDYTLDGDAKIITTILTAPMVVGHWINSQYLFSTIDNIAFGAGNKITHNITGKSFIMQGNASDIMHGLPFQSVYESDYKAYHEPVRLTTFVYGSKDLISQAIEKSDILQKLFGNQWVFLYCFDLQETKKYLLDNLQWREI